MTQTCQYKYILTPQKKCPYPPLPNDKFCLFHSQNDNKNKNAFWDGIQKKLQDKDFDFEGYYFPPGLEADFDNIGFTDANFRLTIFKDRISFCNARFSGEGDTDFCGTIFSGDSSTKFRSAKFSGKGGTYFTEATFSSEGGTDFSYSTFSGEGSTGFSFTRFFGKGGTDFSYSTFSGEGGTDFGFARFSGKGGIYFNNATFSSEGSIDFSNTIFSGERGTNFSSANFTECNTVLFEDTRFETGCEFLYANFPRKADQMVIFRGGRNSINLSKCSFLYSNPERLIFRNFKFIENEPEEFFGLPIWSRSSVLADEKTVDKDETVSRITEEVTTDEKAQIKQELAKADYSHVEALYRQFKKNLEEERNWEDAGEFHYGEMECKRKGLTAPQGWPEFIGPLRQNLGLLACYRYFSGYGERPLRALCGLVFFIFLFAGFYWWLDAPPRQPFWDYYLWNLSIKAAFLQRIGETGNDPAGIVGKFFYLLESALCPTLIAMFILALRRRVKR